MLNQKKLILILPAVFVALFSIKSISASLIFQRIPNEEYINNMAEAPMDDLLQFQTFLTSIAHQRIKSIRKDSQNFEGRSRYVGQHVFSPMLSLDEVHSGDTELPLRSLGSCVMRGIFIMSLTASLSTLLFVIGVMLYQALWEKIEQSRANRGYTHLPDEEDPEQQEQEDEGGEEEDEEEIPPPAPQPEKKKKKKFCNPLIKAIKGTLHHPTESSTTPGNQPN